MPNIVVVNPVSRHPPPGHSTGSRALPPPRASKPRRTNEGVVSDVLLLAGALLFSAVMYGEAKAYHEAFEAARRGPGVPLSSVAFEAENPQTLLNNGACPPSKRAPGQ